MSYYWFNRKELLKKAHKNTTKKVAKKRQKSIIKITKKPLKKEKETNTK